MARLTQDVDALEKLVTTDVVEIVAETFTFLVIVIYLFYADWKLTILILLTLPIMVYLTPIFWDADARFLSRITITRCSN